MAFFVQSTMRVAATAQEHQQHLDLAALYPKIAVAYTRIATISTDDHHTLQEFRGSGLIIHSVYNGSGGDPLSPTSGTTCAP